VVAKSSYRRYGRYRYHRCGGKGGFRFRTDNRRGVPGVWRAERRTDV